MLEVIVVDPELEVDGGIAPRVSGAGHPEEVEADHHRVVELDAALLGPTAHREAPQGGEALYGDGERPGVEPLLALSDLTLIDKALVNINIAVRVD